MMKRWVLLVLAAVVCLGFVTAKSEAGLVDATTTFGEATTWNGFGEDFAPEWEGETMVVENWVEPTESGTSCVTSTGCVDYDATLLAWLWGQHSDEVLVPGYWETRPTVRMIDSSFNTRVSNNAWLRFDGQKYTASKNDNDVSEMARYATLMSPEGKLLANASSIAFQSNSFCDDEFSANGRVSAVAILTNAAEEASADATGRSWFDVSYELDQETAFSLELDIAQLGEVEITFSATNIETGEVAFSFETVETGIQQEICMDGILEAGKYKFAMNCLTDSSVDSSGGLNTGGQAMFNLALDLEEEYVQVWIPEHYERISGFVIGDFSAASSSVPEPSVLGLSILGGFFCLLGRRR